MYQSISSCYIPYMDMPCTESGSSYVLHQLREITFSGSCRIGVVRLLFIQSIFLESNSFLTPDCSALWFFALLPIARSSVSVARFLILIAPTWSASSSYPQHVHLNFLLSVLLRFRLLQQLHTGHV